MAYTIQAYADVHDDLADIAEPFQKRIRKAIHALGDNPRPAGAIKMSGYANLYRVRIGQYRIIYFIHDRQLHIVVVAATTRGKAYEIMKRRLKK